MISVISIALLIVLIVIAGIAIRNLMIKVEKYEDIAMNQATYLQNISEVIRDSQKHLNEIDEKGAFKSDDEVGYFFEQLKTVQQELDRYMLPENYGKEEIIE